MSYLIKGVSPIPKSDLYKAFLLLLGLYCCCYKFNKISEETYFFCTHWLNSHRQKTKMDYIQTLHLRWVGLHHKFFSKLWSVTISVDLWYSLSSADGTTWTSGWSWMMWFIRFPSEIVIMHEYWGHCASLNWHIAKWLVGSSLRRVCRHPWIENGQGCGSFSRIFSANKFLVRPVVGAKLCLVLSSQ